MCRAEPAPQLLTCWFPAMSNHAAQMLFQRMSDSHALKHPGRVAFDAGVIKMFWEEKIKLHTRQLQSEAMRTRRSALDR